MTTRMVVDDAPAPARVIGDNLRREDYEVRTAANGAAALRDA
jgi:CheY-like chemotaxis protein